MQEKGFITCFFLCVCVSVHVPGMCVLRGQFVSHFSSSSMGTPRTELWSSGHGLDPLSQLANPECVLVNVCVLCNTLLLIFPRSRLTVLCDARGGPASHPPLYLPSPHPSHPPSAATWPSLALCQSSLLFPQASPPFLV